MVVYLFVLFTLVPFMELALLIWIGGEIGPVPTLALVVVTGIVGAALARSQGLSAVRRIRSEFASGKMPTDSLLDAFLIVGAGALLLTPGVLTDAAGLGLLIPPLRRWVRRAFRYWARSHFDRHIGSFTSPIGNAGGDAGSAGRHRAPRDVIIDAKVIGTRVVDD